MFINKGEGNGPNCHVPPAPGATIFKINVALMSG